MTGRDAAPDAAEPTIRVATRLSEGEIEQLAGLLVAVVASGAAVSFLAPLAPAEARRYWRRVAASNATLLVAEQADKIVGTVQLIPAESDNGRHRAEVAKLLVHPDSQRQGIGRRLMARLESLARADARTLLVLDSREGDAATDLYQRLGYRQAGRIPAHVRSADGTLAATLFFYKLLT